LRLNLSVNDIGSVTSSDRGATVGEATSPVVQANRRTTPRRCALSRHRPNEGSAEAMTRAQAHTDTAPPFGDIAEFGLENIDFLHAGQGTESCAVTSYKD